MIDKNAVAKLPLAIRNWDDLLALVPGVQGDRYTEQGGGTSFGRTGGVNVHGARSLQNNFLLDGVDNNSISYERAGAHHPAVSPVGGRHSGVQGRHQPVLGRVRPLPGRGDQRVHQVGHQRAPRHGLRLLPQRRMDTNDFFSKRAGRKPTNDQNQFGGNLGGPDREGQGLLLRGLRGHADHPRRDPPHRRAHCRRARGQFTTARARSPHRPALPRQRHPGRPHRSLRGGHHGPGPPAQPGGGQQLLPPGRPHRQLGPDPRPPRRALRRTTASSLRYIYSSATARSPAPSGE